MKLFKPIIVNKNLVDFGQRPISFRLNNAYDIFVREGTLLNMSGETSLASMSFDILNTMGVTMIDPLGHCGTDDGFEFLVTNPKEFTKDYSFSTDRNADEGINNPNITDPDIGRLRPQKIEAGDKFIAVNDSFYEPDEDLPDSFKQNDIIKRNQIKSHLIRSADRMCLLAQNKKHKRFENKYLNVHKTKQIGRTN